MKKSAIIVAAAVATMICSGVSAAPITDYSSGKTAIDLMFRSSDLSVKKSVGDEFSFNKKSDIDWGITTGLGNNIAVQYNSFNGKTKDALTYKDAFETDMENFEFKIQELNLLYKLDKNVSVYTGIVRYNAIDNLAVSVIGVGAVNYQTSTSSETKSKMQIGLIGSTKIAAKTTAYGQVGVASDFTNLKVGLSQEIAPNLAFNVDYRRIEAKNLTISSTSFGATSKGLGYGVTYKF